MIRRLSVIALTLLAAGCGGGGSSSVPANAPVPGGTSGASISTANALVQITIPSATSALVKRRAQYVSPATQSMSITAGTGAAIVVPLSAGSPGCVAQSNATVCSVNVPLPIGANQTALVKTFAAANATGAALSVVQTAPFTVVAGTTNAVLTFTLDGVPASVALTTPTTIVPSLAATAIPVSVTVKDASGNTIIGSAPFANANGTATAIALTNSDTSGATIITPASLSAPGTASVAYDNYYQPTAATITASATGVTTATGTITFAAKPIVFTHDNSTVPPTLQSGAVITSTARHTPADRRRAQQVATYERLGALVPTGNAVTPYSVGTNSFSANTIRSYSFNPPFGIATTNAGHLVSTGYNGSLSGLFDLGTVPAAPGAILGGTASQVFGPIALAPGNKMLAGVNGGFQQIDPTTGIAIGSVVPVPAQFGSGIPNAIAVGPDGTVYIEAFFAVDGGTDNVLAFSPTALGYVFARSFSTQNSAQSQDAIYGLAVDASNQVYVSCDYYGTLDVVPAASTGLVTPTMVYGNYSEADDGLGVTIDRAGNVLWVNYQYVTIFAPNSGSVPTTGQPFPDYTVPLQTMSIAGDGAAFTSITPGPGF